MTVQTDAPHLAAAHALTASQALAALATGGDGL